MSNDSFVGDSLHPAAKAVFAGIGTAMVLSGVIGNIILISVTYKQFVRKRCAHHLFIANLALADLVTMGYWFTFLVLDLVLGYHPVVNEAHCRVNGYLVAVTLFATITFLTTVSLNRYLHVCHSRLYKRFFTLKTSVAICLAIWVAGFIVSLPPVFKSVPGSFHYNKDARLCTYNRKGFTYPKAMIIIFTIVPMFFIGYWNWAIFRFWRTNRLKYPRLKTPEPQGKPSHQAVVAGQSHQPDEAVSGGSQMMEDRIHVTAEESDDSLDDATSQSNTLGLDRGTDEAGHPSAEDSLAAGHSEITTVLSRVSETVDDDDDSEALSNAHSDTLNRPKSASKVTGKEMDFSQATVSLTQPAESTEAADELNQPPRRSLRTIKQDDSKVDLGKIPKANPNPPNQSKRRHQRSHMESVRRRQKKKRAKEMALVRSLFVVSILFIAFFLPFGVLSIIGYYIQFSSEVNVMAAMLLFFNNSVNWIVYGVFNPSIRKGYVQCLLAVAKCPAAAIRKMCGRSIT